MISSNEVIQSAVSVALSSVCVPKGFPTQPGDAHAWDERVSLSSIMVVHLTCLRCNMVIHLDVVPSR